MNSPTGIILDTHIWIRWINQNDGLPAALSQRIDQAERLYISVVSIYEFVWLIQRGRINLTLDMDAWLQASTTDVSINPLPVTAAIARRAAGLPMIHGDPIDRLIIATSLENALALMSIDGQFTHYTELQSLLIHQG